MGHSGCTSVTTCFGSGGLSSQAAYVLWVENHAVSKLVLIEEKYLHFEHDRLLQNVYLFSHIGKNSKSSC